MCICVYVYIYIYIYIYAWRKTVYFPLLRLQLTNKEEQQSLQVTSYLRVSGKHRIEPHRITSAFDLRILIEHNHFLDFGGWLPFHGKLTTTGRSFARPFDCWICCLLFVHDDVYRNSERDVWLTMRSAAQNSILPQQLVLAVPLTYCCKVGEGDFQLERYSSAK